MRLPYCVSGRPSMKYQFVIALTLALFCSMTFATAQNAPTTNISPSPSSINKSSRATLPSGAENQTTAAHKPQHVAGDKKYCRPSHGGSSLNCFFASMKSCQKQSKGNNLRCVTNPDRG